MRTASSRAFGALATDTAIGFALFSLPILALYLLLSILVLSFAYQFPARLFRDAFVVIALAGALGAVTGALMNGLIRFPEARLGRATPSPWWNALCGLARLVNRAARQVVQPHPWSYFVVAGSCVGLLTVTFMPIRTICPAQWREYAMVPTLWEIASVVLPTHSNNPDLGKIASVLYNARAGGLDWSKVWFFVGWNMVAALDIGLLLGFLVRWMGDFYRWWTGEAAHGLGRSR